MDCHMGANLLNEWKINHILSPSLVNGWMVNQYLSPILTIGPEFRVHGCGSQHIDLPIFINPTLLLIVSFTYTIFIQRPLEGSITHTTFIQLFNGNRHSKSAYTTTPEPNTSSPYKTPLGHRRASLKTMSRIFGTLRA